MLHRIGFWVVYPSWGYGPAALGWAASAYRRRTQPCAGGRDRAMVQVSLGLCLIGLDLGNVLIQATTTRAVSFASVGTQVACTGFYSGAALLLWPVVS